jgi:hypothetical protein
MVQQGCVQAVVERHANSGRFPQGNRKIKSEGTKDLEVEQST